jgi:hypothetical protein
MWKAKALYSNSRFLFNVFLYPIKIEWSFLNVGWVERERNPPEFKIDFAS